MTVLSDAELSRRAGLFWAYLALAVIGAFVPLAAFVPWVAANGLDARALVQHLFVNRISTFFGLDVIISAIVVLVLVDAEPNVPGRWWAALATVTIGVSCCLPLFLTLRERAMRRE
ncbi:hypothetical protein FHS31_000711 [Sphingomonas vulcanisoli]|uniref:DUF2834 domain-containing protein n=1 Tax=Sphingomonas vulcanisoli TaxID=1658060 RepID=A0ABX0TSM8_9SPHN|nr:DUF2834 domain-containing protein [Sphingomonas vulcanisoli]NIJ07129.1 hypothetical protein [Sphingomonas vulcanisoli]